MAKFIELTVTYPVAEEVTETKYLFNVDCINFIHPLDKGCIIYLKDGSYSVKEGYGYIKIVKEGYGYIKMELNSET